MSNDSITIPDGFIFVPPDNGNPYLKGNKGITCSIDNVNRNYCTTNAPPIGDGENR